MPNPPLCQRRSPGGMLWSILLGAALVQAAAYDLEVAVMDYDGKQAVLQGEVWVDVFDQKGECVTSYGIRREGGIGERKIGGDVLTLKVDQPGPYTVSAKAMKEVELWQTLNTGGILIPEPAPGDQDADGKGAYAILEVQKLYDPDPSKPSQVVGYKLKKRYPIAASGYATTHVAEQEPKGQKLDRALVLLRMNAAEDWWRGLKETAATTVLKTGLEAVVPGSGIWTRMGRGAVATVAFQTATDAEHLVTGEMLAKLVKGGIITLAFPSAGGAIAAKLALAYAPPIIVGAIGRVQIEQRSDSDDYEAAAAGDARMGSSRQGAGSLTFRNLGLGLHQVSVWVSGPSPMTGRIIAVRASADTDLVPFNTTKTLSWAFDFSGDGTMPQYLTGISVRYGVALPDIEGLFMHRDEVPYTQAGAGLRIVSKPEGAAVSVNGLDVGATTPLSYPLPDRIKKGDTVKVEGRLQGYETVSQEVKVEGTPDQLVELVFSATPPEDKGLLDLVLCIDRSGSMMDDIQAVQQSADATLTELEAYSKQKGISLQVGLVTYLRPDEPDWLRAEPLTADLAAMRARIQAITITDPALGKGGNEETYGALLYAMNQKVGDRHLPQEKPPAGMGWRPGAAKIALPIGDEPPDETLFNLAQVSKVAEELDPLHAYPILVPKQAGGTVAPGTRSSLARLARATGGEVITASSAADLPKRIVATVKLAVRRHKEEVWRKSNPPFFLFGTHALVIAGGLGMVLLAAGSHRYWLAKRRAAMAAARRSADPRLTGQSYVRPGPDASPPPSPSERG